MNYLVTGGTGSVGSAIVERLLQDGHKVRVFSRDETKQHEMRAKFPDAEYLLGDLRDRWSVYKACAGIERIIHAGAMKHVPASEKNPLEAIQTNVLGTQNLLDAATDRGVEGLIAISTDKACQPNSVMGMTKALMERLLVSHPQDHPRCVVARFGNVVPSRGSVFPLFLKQIAEGGPVTVTDPNMTRFLFPLKEAVTFVIEAESFGGHRCIHVPKLRAAYVGDIAKVLIAGRRIDIKIIGARPGESLHEALVAEEELSFSEDYRDFCVLRPQETRLIRHLSPYQGYESNYHVMGWQELREMLEKCLPEWAESCPTPAS